MVAQCGSSIRNRHPPIANFPRPNPVAEPGFSPDTQVIRKCPDFPPYVKFRARPRSVVPVPGITRPTSSRLRRARSASAYTVHPHVRGEHADATTFDFRGNGSPPRAWGRWTVPGVPWDSPGSPPRAWGRPGRELQPSPVRRFTPTRVGKTDGQTPRSEVPAVHPHARGEDTRPR